MKTYIPQALEMECDRCGIKGEAGVSPFYRMANIGFSAFGEHSPEHVHMDLCDSCAGGFEAWSQKPIP